METGRSYIKNLSSDVKGGHSRFQIYYDLHWNSFQHPTSNLAPLSFPLARATSGTSTTLTTCLRPSPFCSFRRCNGSPFHSSALPDMAMWDEQLNCTHAYAPTEPKAARTRFPQRGARVEVWWEDRDKSFCGVLASKHGRTRQFCFMVHYDDGDKLATNFNDYFWRYCSSSYHSVTQSASSPTPAKAITLASAKEMEEGGVWHVPGDAQERFMGMVWKTVKEVVRKYYDSAFFQFHWQNVSKKCQKDKLHETSCNESGNASRAATSEEGEDWTWKYIYGTMGHWYWSKSKLKRPARKGKWQQCCAPEEYWRRLFTRNAISEFQSRNWQGGMSCGVYFKVGGTYRPGRRRAGIWKHWWPICYFRHLWVGCHAWICSRSENATPYQALAFGFEQSLIYCTLLAGFQFFHLSTFSPYGELSKLCCEVVTMCLRSRSVSSWWPQVSSGWTQLYDIWAYRHKYVAVCFACTVHCTVYVEYFSAQ